MFLLNHDIFCFVIAKFVALLTVFADPLIAVIIGSLIMLLRQIHRISVGGYEISVNKNKKLTHRLTGKELNKLEHGNDPLVYSFNTDLTYFNRDAHMKRIEHISQKTKNIILRFRSVSYIDADGVLMLEELIETFETHNSTVYFCGLSEYVELVFRKTHFLNNFIKKGRVYEKTQDVLDFLYSGKVSKIG